MRQKAEGNFSKSELEGNTSAPGSIPSNLDNSSTPWKDLLVSKDNESGVMELQYFPPSEVDGKILVTPPPFVGEIGVKKWQSSLVGYFLDRQIPFMAVKSIVFKIWAKFGITDVLSNDNGFYFFLFNNDDGYKRLLDSGPSHIGGRLMVLKKWEPQMCLVKDQLAKIPIWVQLSNVPLEYWTAPGLSYVASAIGRPLYADSVTKRCTRLSYARVCVEIEVGAYLPSSFWLRLDNGKDVEITVKYPWKPLQCLDCKVFGHNEAGCKKNIQPNEAVPPQVPLQIPQQQWVAKPRKDITGAIDSGSAKAISEELFKQASVSPSNRFAALVSTGLDSDATLGFVESTELLDVVSVSTDAKVTQLGDQVSEMPCCPVAANIVVHTTSLVGSPKAEANLSFCPHVDQQLPSSSHESNVNSTIVLSPKRGCDQVIDFAVEQGIQLVDKAADISKGLNGGPEPPGQKKKPKKPNKKR